MITNPKWIKAAGLVQPSALDPAHGPAASYIHDKVVDFAFHDPSGDYLVRGPILTVDQGRALVWKRMRDFKAHPHTRESFRHKLIRKWLAAHGPLFVRRLSNKKLAMEVDMMFSPKSHHGVVSRKAMNAIGKSGKAKETILRPEGYWAKKKPGAITTNDGEVFKS